jgi:acyl dehydratase
MAALDVRELPSLIGQEHFSSWVSVNQDLIDRFADVTNDHQWIHVDVERSKRENGGTTIAHGFLTLSLMSAMSYELLEVSGITHGLNYGFDKLRFTAPVPAGSRVRMRAKMLSVDLNGNCYRIKRECTVEIEGQDKPAIYAEWIGLFYV